MTIAGRHEDTGRISLTSLVKEFTGRDGTTRAVDDVDLVTEPGEFLTLLGPSGCGKTTTLRMIAGFETPTSGEILLDGADMTRLTPDKRPMSMVFQSYALFPHLSVFDNVAYGLKLKKMSKAEITEAVDSALASMDLVKLAGRAPNQLSGGQQQRVALARAMVMRPKVLLFDEPLSNLDAKLRVQMRTEIRSLQQRLGITALYVTHDQDEAMSLSDRIVVMNKGKIEQCGTPDEIYRRPATVFVADFIGSANFLDPASVSVVDDVARVDVLGSQRELPAAPGAASATAHVVLVRPESVQVRRVADAPADVAPGEAVVGGRGRILRAVFYGSVVEYEIDTDAGTIIAEVADPDPSDIMVEGELVEVDFPRSRGWLLPA
ncbi:MAG: ABC transporter ATP-binding protein [Propioniciclava sp.]|uniref:ABC transporter ATP-binding protein n=1 Tax=Propioniciclava sp. TaxID=2038686 RepID=UPI0039E4F70F